MAIDSVESTLKPPQITATLIQSAVAKSRTRADVVFFKAFMAGAMLSFGGLLSEIVSGGSGGVNASNPGLVKVLSGFVFPVGLVMIVLQGQELLTSNMMVFPMALMKGAIPWWSLPMNWVIVMFGNLTGSLFFGAILVKYSGVLSAEPFHTAVQTFAIHKARDPEWHQIFLRGIGCNWLVCVAIWQATGARETISKIVAIWFPIWVFVACGFDHVVANMFSVPLGIMFGADLTVAGYIRKSFIAAFLGNVIGALLVGPPAVYFFLRERDDPMAKAESGEVYAEGKGTEGRFETSENGSSTTGR